jgi:ribosome-associated translation inhibitor RaiA
MQVQINTDKATKGDEKQQAYFVNQIESALANFQSHITSIDVHLADQNGKKDGWDDIQCILEAKLEGRHPIAVTNQANTIEQALAGAIHKLKASLETILGKMQHQQN